MAPSDDQRFLDLLQRWQSGDFTRQEERLLRSLTEADDFRREAMEGFMALPEADHPLHLAALRERLRVAAPPRSRRVTMPQIMAVAAALLVLVAAIWFFPRLEKQNDSMAQASEKAAPSPAAAPQIPEAAPQPTDAMADQMAARQQPAGRPSAGLSPEQQASRHKRAAAEADPTIVSSAQEETERPPSAVKPANTPPRPPVTEAPGSPSATFSKAKTTTQPAQARPDSTDLAWNDTEKKSDLTKLREQARADQLGPIQSEPAEGWAVFAEYLRQSARLPLEARDRNVSGAVRLQFTVNANGDPQNFVVLRSLGRSCDDEAKRLIQNWDWIRGQNPLVVVEVKFVR